MTAEQGLILGLGLVAYMVMTLAKEFEERKDQMHKSLLAFAMFFIIGMEYTARGIAKSTGYTRAETAYTFALVITVLAFLAMIYRIYQQIKEEAQNQSAMEGF